MNIDELGYCHVCYGVYIKKGLYKVTGPTDSDIQYFCGKHKVPYDKWFIAYLTTGYEYKEGESLHAMIMYEKDGHYVDVNGVKLNKDIKKELS